MPLTESAQGFLDFLWELVSGNDLMISRAGGRRARLTNRALLSPHSGISLRKMGNRVHQRKEDRLSSNWQINSCTKDLMKAIY